MRNVVIAVAVLSASCAQPPEPPVAELLLAATDVPLIYAASTSLPVDWKPLRDLDPSDASPFLFVHLLDRDGRILRTYDRPAPAQLTGRDTIEIWQTLLTEPLPVGRYRLTIGLYDTASGRRWRLETGGVEIDEGKYEIARVEVASTRRETPSLIFEGEWLEADVGQKHNPGRRWMGERGTIRVFRTDGWSELVLSLATIELPADQYPLTYARGASTPELVIRNGCDSDAETRLDGYGVWTVALKLNADDPCVITLDPNFVMVDPEGKRRSIGLEAAFFRP